MLVFRSAPLTLRATSPGRGRHARQGRQRKHTEFMPVGYVYFTIEGSIYTVFRGEYILWQSVRSGSMSNLWGMTGMR